MLDWHHQGRGGDQMFGPEHYGDTGDKDKGTFESEFHNDLSEIGRQPITFTFTVITLMELHLDLLQ